MPAYTGQEVIDCCTAADGMGWFKPSELDINEPKKFKRCQNAHSSGLMLYNPKTRRYMVNPEWRALLILRGNPILSEKHVLEKEKDEPLISRAEKKKIAESTVQSAIRNRTAIEKVWL